MSIMDDVMHDIPAGTFQCDEIWFYVWKKDKRLVDGERHDLGIGSQYIFLATDAGTKLVPSYCIGKRVPELAFGLIVDVAERIIGCPTIITDWFAPNLDAVEMAFGADVDFAQLIKTVSEAR